MAWFCSSLRLCGGGNSSASQLSASWSSGQDAWVAVEMERLHGVWCARVSKTGLMDKYDLIMMIVCTCCFAVWLVEGWVCLCTGGWHIANGFYIEYQLSVRVGVGMIKVA